MQKADYGIDAPITQRNLAILGAVGVLLLFFPAIGRFTVWPGIALLVAAGIMHLGSRVLKIRHAHRLIERLNLQGDEQVLDVGCGRGLLANLAAKRLRTGKVVGVDIWRDVDLAGNSREAALENARREGVAPRVEIRTADARELPFPAATFDVVVSSWAIHNIAVSTGRSKAIQEMVRVLKPGGKIAILDIEDTAEYLAELRKQGFEKLERLGPSFLFLLPSYTVCGTKPVSVSAQAVVQIESQTAPKA